MNFLKYQNISISYEYMYYSHPSLKSLWFEISTPNALLTQKSNSLPFSSKRNDNSPNRTISVHRISSGFLTLILRKGGTWSRARDLRVHRSNKCKEAARKRFVAHSCRLAPCRPSSNIAVFDAHGWEILILNQRCKISAREARKDFSGKTRYFKRFRDL